MSRRAGSKCTVTSRTAFTLLIGATILCATAANAQNPTGRIVGRILDAETGRGISDAGVQVVGTTLGTMSRVDGRYALPSVEAGTVTLHVRLLGYQPKTVTGLLLPAAGTIEQDIVLDVATLQLAAQVVTAEAERGSVNAALDAQRNAVGIVNAVTAEQIAKSPDSDAAQAVQRVSGVTVQDGKYVFVRGLGERYTTTSLNGARMPSPEPERKVIPLDLFPASLIQSVTTSKTFTPDQPGDFSGAQVDIHTREFPAQRQVSYSMSAGMNDAATGARVIAAPSEGLEWLAFGGRRRTLPGIVASAGDFEPAPAQSEVNRMVGAFRNAWTVRQRSGAPNSSVGASVGGNDSLFGRRIGYVGSFTYSYNQEVRKNEVRAYAQPASAGGTTEVDRFEGMTGRTSILWGGLLNLSTMVGNSRISLNNVYNRTADNEARSEEGFGSENLGLYLHVDRLRFVARSMRSSQLSGVHQLGDEHRIDWALTASGVTRREPDRSEIVYAREDANATPFWLNDSQSAVRTFADVDENSYSASGDYTLHFGAALRQRAKFGGLLRYTDRRGESRVYSIQGNLSREERELAPEHIFGGSFAESGSSVFRVAPLSQGGSYTATDALGAGYAMIEWMVGDRLRLTGGARVEQSLVDVEAEPTVGRAVNVEPSYTDVLPSAALTLKLTDQQNLRLSASQTLARPEYRELAGIQYREVLGGEIVQGNPALRRTLIRNADVRWEWYPGPGEVMSVGLFAKQFEDPIERIYLATSGSRVVTFVNAEGADNYGVELEARSGLAFVGLSPFSVHTNATFMRSEIRLGARDTHEQNANRAMVGQAPYVVNAGLTYATAGARMSASVLYNIVGRRILNASEAPLPEVYEEARSVLDLSIRFPVLGPITGKFDVKNFLDEPYEITQGSVTRAYYTVGRVLSLGLTWRD